MTHKLIMAWRHVLRQLATLRFYLTSRQHTLALIMPDNTKFLVDVRHSTRYSRSWPYSGKSRVTESLPCAIVFSAFFIGDMTTGDILKDKLSPVRESGLDYMLSMLGDLTKIPHIHVRDLWTFPRSDAAAMLARLSLMVDSKTT